MLHLIDRRGLSDKVKVDSAGTGAYHVGNEADSRSAAAARRRGVKLPSRARQFQKADFSRFHYVLAMDTSNYRHLHSLSGGLHDDRLHMFLDFHTGSPKGSSVPDPYYGGEQGFEHVLDLCFAACEELLDELIARHDLRPEG